MYAGHDADAFFEDDSYFTPTSPHHSASGVDDDESGAVAGRRNVKKPSKYIDGGSGSTSPSMDPSEYSASCGKPVSRMNVPLFISKLYQIVHTSVNPEVIGWSSEGQTFVVGNSVSFARDILPVYFKHNNFSSFVRQLNFYGFKSSSTVSLDGKNKRMWEFRHPYFRQNGEHLLHKIKRKTCQQEESPVNLKSEVDDMRADMEMLRAEVMNMSKQLEMVTTILRRAAMAKQKKRKVEEYGEGYAPYQPVKKQAVEARGPGLPEWPMDEPIPPQSFGLDEFHLTDF